MDVAMSKMSYFDAYVYWVLYFRYNQPTTQPNVVRRNDLFRLRVHKP